MAVTLDCGKCEVAVVDVVLVVLLVLLLLLFELMGGYSVVVVVGVVVVVVVLVVALVVVVLILLSSELAHLLSFTAHGWLHTLFSASQTVPGPQLKSNFVKPVPSFLTHR